MSRLVMLVLLLSSLCVTAASIYRTTDEQGNVVFTDAPPADGGAVEPVDIQRTNTTTPPPNLPPASQTDGRKSKPATAAYTVTITQPANETSIPMGPGNFTVSVKIYPPLKKYESLQLFMDGEPWGLAQANMIWDLTNVFRGQHDITVGVINTDGETLTMSPPVRIFVHRPSKNFRNR
jgi:hypothetical protein